MNGCIPNVLAQARVVRIAGLPDGGLPEPDVAGGDVEITRLHPEVFGIRVAGPRGPSPARSERTIRTSPRGQSPRCAARWRDRCSRPPTRRVAWLPSSRAQWSSTQRIFWTGSSRREVTRTGRRFTWNAASAIRAERFEERTAEKVATASTSVPRAVANDAMVAQSVSPASRRPRHCRSHHLSTHGGQITSQSAARTVSHPPTPSTRCRHGMVSRRPSDRENAPRSSRGQGGAPERSEDERP